ncbi:MAG: GntR family transcriptional regulator, N-acetylglucosamine utilization regulator [Thermoleophilaceae bacterium]|jgi:GntR family transcriptional regulator|nr:GntR family transcriptional regulator, N-acetylglucosamine utilization regulator [Thermoleophilaceae bacterium]
MSLSGRHDKFEHRPPALGGLSVRRDSAIPYYEQLKQVLVSQLASGEYQPGDSLPSEHELCDTYGVSRTVVRQALGDMVNDGLLYRMRGKGTFVAKPKLREQFIESTVGFFEDLTSRGHVVESRVISCERVQPSAQVADALELAEGMPCIELIRLRSVNHEVVAFTKSYLPLISDRFFEDLRATDLARVSLYRYLEERWGVLIESGHRSLEATVATGLLAQLLEIHTGAPVLAIESIGRDADERVVEYFQAWHRGDRTRLEMDVVRGQVPLVAAGVR